VLNGLEVEDVVIVVRDEDGTVDVRQASTGVGAAAVGIDPAAGRRRDSF
jgi:uncharacterized membrane protein